MKKIILASVIGLLVLVVAVVVAIGLLLDKGIKKGVETVGPMVTKTTVQLDSVGLSILSGAGKVKGMVIGNPEGFKAPSCISVGTAKLAVSPGSIFSDKVVIKSVVVEAPEVTFETDFRHNNLSRLLDNVKAATGGAGGGDSKPKPAPTGDQPKSSKKLQVDEFIVTGGKIHIAATALGGQGATVPLPEIRLTNLGQGPDGITGAELFRVVLDAVEKSAVPAATKALADLGKGALDLGKGLGKSGTNTVDSVTKGVGDLFKKK